MASDTDLIRPAQLNDGVVTNAAYTVAHAIKDWLADGLAGRTPKTVSTQREVLEPPIGIIGAVPLRELPAATVRSALKELAARDAARCGGRAPIAPDDLQESGPRRAVDAARVAPHLCLSAVRQRDGDRGDQPPHGPQFIECY